MHVNYFVRCKFEISEFQKYEGIKINIHKCRSLNPLRSGQKISNPGLALLLRVLGAVILLIIIQISERIEICCRALFHLGTYSCKMEHVLLQANVKNSLNVNQNSIK